MAVRTWAVRFVVADLLYPSSSPSWRCRGYRHSVCFSAARSGVIEGRGLRFVFSSFFVFFFLSIFCLGNSFVFAAEFSFYLVVRKDLATEQRKGRRALRLRTYGGKAVSELQSTTGCSRPEHRGLSDGSGGLKTTTERWRERGYCDCDRTTRSAVVRQQKTDDSVPVK